MSGIDDTRLKRAFLEEAEELSQKLGECLMDLEADRANTGLVNEVFRLTHSLKSESALMGYSVLSELAHRMEDVLGLARSGSLMLGKPVMDSLFAGADLIAEMMTAIGKGGSDSDFTTGAILQGLSAAGGILTATPAARGGTAPAGSPGASAAMPLGDFEKLQLAEARDRGESLLRLTVHVDPAEAMKFPRAYLVFTNLETLANVVKVSPPMDGEIADDSLYGSTVILLTTGSEEATVRAASGVDQISEVNVERCTYDAFLSAAARAGEGPDGLAAEDSPSVPGTLPVGALEDPAHRPESAQDPRRAAPVEKASIRVDTRKLDDLWSLIAELVLHKSHIARLSEDIVRGKDVHSVREELVESFDSLDKISSGMQQAMMDTRMIPISVIFSKFPRLVRDLSRKLGKPVDLVLSGEDTEIDRSIVEALSDPLTHIIRNSLDHGIEFAEERVRHGKKEKGRVSVTARRQGGNIVIELEDDGRGMDVESIRRKAVSLGVSGVETFTQPQLLDLVFLPGFSTKEVVTDVSGRGVGMDVVATRIRGDLKGDVVLRTEQFRGTRVTLFLPLTLTIVNALLVRGDAQLYALPLTDVDSTAKLLSTEIHGDEGRESAQWMDEEIPVYSLGALFGSGKRRMDEYFAAVLRHGDRRAFLVVDELMEEREVVIKPVDDLLNSLKMFSGVSVLENGKLVFILDTAFIRREHF
jgi:two-component system chemotaxis sensor kinase CheA